MNESNEHEETILEKALEIDSQEARNAYLMGACGDDVELRRRLERLIVAHRKSGNFLNKQARDDDESVTAALTESPITEGPGGFNRKIQAFGKGGRRRFWSGVHGRAKQTHSAARRTKNHHTGHGHQSGCWSF
jgi:hypothetical protein